MKYEKKKKKKRKRQLIDVDGPGENPMYSFIIRLNEVANQTKPAPLWAFENRNAGFFLKSQQIRK